MSGLCKFAVGALAAALIAAQLPGHAGALSLSNVEARIAKTENDDGSSVVSLLFDRVLFGADGLGTGWIAYPPDPVHPIRIYAEPTGIAGIGDLQAGISFIIDDAGNVMGIEPTPFVFFMELTDGSTFGDVLNEKTSKPVNSTQTFAALDFSEVSGTLGSLILSRVKLNVTDITGQVHAITLEDFHVTAVPLPFALPLLAFAVGFAALIGGRRTRPA